MCGTVVPTIIPTSCVGGRPEFTFTPRSGRCRFLARIRPALVVPRLDALAAGYQPEEE